MENSDTSLGGAVMAPGESNHCTGHLAVGGPAAEPGVKTLDYSTDFPAMLATPAANGGIGANPLDSNQANLWPVRKTKPINVTSIFHLPADERRRENGSGGFGDKNPDQSACNNIAEATETSIELSEAKDGSLTIVVTGKRPKVEEARRLVLSGLQQQGERSIPIPKEHHKIIIGRGGEKLADYEKATDCKITVPGRDSSSNLISIRGPREGIEKAVQMITLASEVESGRDQAHIVCPRIYYPWIRGPGDENVNRIKEENRVLIHIPPPQANSEVIHVVGDKDGVAKASAALRKIQAEKEATVKSITCKVAVAQHRYVIGPQRSGLDEVLRTTGVSVEVPPAGSEDDTITLRGDPARLGDALAAVYSRAASNITRVMECPAWLHKFIIGTRGANIKQITADMPKLSINLQDDNIVLDGGPEDVQRAEEALSAIVSKLKAEMDHATLKVHPQYHRHVIGKNGANISKMKQETGVLISIPDPDAKDPRRNAAFSSPEEIRIEGNKEGVAKAAKEILEIVKRLENEKSKDIIVEQRFHKVIIGARGDNITKLRDQFPSVNISFPEPGRKSDIVTLRGDKVEVDKCAKLISAQVKDLQESNFQVRVPIFKDFHKNIIGKGGATIRKIREETDTRIELPSEASGDDAITVTGRKANVEKAVAQLQKIQNELASVVTVEVAIPKKLHSRLIGGGGRLLQDISDQCGGAQIKFPDEKTNSDKVTIRGPKDEAEKAGRLLSELAKDKELSSHEEGIKAKPEYFRFLIGRGGVKIRKVRDAYPNVRILFPRAQDADQETIQVVGKKEEAQAVRRMLEDLIKELGERHDDTVDVDGKHHKHFVARGAAVLREIQDTCGGVTISFPRQGSASTAVAISGSKDGVAEAKKRILEIVGDLECSITINVPIAKDHHRTLLGNRGMKIQKICREHNVEIKFPDRNQETEEEEGVAVTGRPERCEAAKVALEGLVPISKTVPVPFEHHRAIIGKGGQEVRELMTMHDVGIQVPKPEERRDEIVINGTPEAVDAAIEDIQSRIGNLEKLNRERELRRYQLKISLPAEFHPRIIGPRGANINRLRDKHGVEISLPGGRVGGVGGLNNNNGPELTGDEILIQGYEEKARAAAEEMEAMIEEIKNLFVQEITLDARIHPRIIGTKGKNIRKLMDDFEVEIRLPRTGDPDPNLVSVSGKEEGKVYDCIDHLRALEEELMEEVAERYAPPPRTMAETAEAPKSVIIQGAPWNPSQGTGEQEFPSLGGPAPGIANGAANPAPTFGAWGRRH